MRRRSEIPGMTGRAIGISGHGNIVEYHKGTEQIKTQDDAEKSAIRSGKSPYKVNIFRDTTDKIRGGDITEEMMHRKQ